MRLLKYRRNLLFMFLAFCFIQLCFSMNIYAENVNLPLVSVREMTPDFEAADYPTESSYWTKIDNPLDTSVFIDGDISTGMSFCGYSHWYWNAEGTQWLAVTEPRVLVFEYDLSAYNIDDIESVSFTFNAGDSAVYIQNVAHFGAAYIKFGGWFADQSLEYSIYDPQWDGGRIVFDAVSAYGNLPRSISVDKTISFTKTGNDGSYSWNNISLLSLLDSNKHVRVFFTNMANGYNGGPPKDPTYENFYVNEISASLALKETSMTSPQDLIKKGWNLISIPAVPKNASAASVLNGVDMTNASLQKWDNANDSGGGYLIYNQNWDGTMNPGEAYWLIETGNKTLSFLSNETTADDKVISVPAHSKTPYWVMIGHPFDKKIDCSNIKFKVGADTKNWGDAVTMGWIEAAAQGFEASSQSYFNCGLSTNPAANRNAFEPWYGYWMLIKTNQQIDIIIPTSPIVP